MTQRKKMPMERHDGMSSKKMPMERHGGMSSNFFLGGLGLPLFCQAPAHITVLNTADNLVLE